MRKTLASLEGELVVYYGWEVGTRYDKTWVCLSNPYVIIWDRDLSVQDAIKQKGGYRFDHLWLTGDKENFGSQKIKQFKQVGGIGVVRRYRRKNGTVDFTVKTPSDRWVIEDFLGIYNKNFITRSLRGNLKLIEDALRIVALHEGGSSEIVFGTANSVSSFKEELLDHQHSLSSSIEITEKTLETTNMKGKCKKINILQFPNSTVSSSKGF